MSNGQAVMNTKLLKALRECISQYGAESLSDARRVKGMLQDWAAEEPKPQKNALIACVERDFAAALRNSPSGGRGPVKAKLAERLNQEEGLEKALCADTLDLLETALFGESGRSQTNSACRNCGKELRAEWKACPYCGARAGYSPADVHTSVPASPPASSPGAGHGNPLIDETFVLLMTLLYRRYSSSVVNFVAYSPDGRRIVSASSAGSTIKIWDAETGRELQTLLGHMVGVKSVAYSPDGRRIVSGSSAGSTITIWDAETGREIKSLEGYNRSVGSVAYSPDGRRIAAGSGSTIKIWDAKTGRELKTLIGHMVGVKSVAYSPDGRRIVSGSWDRTTRIWDAETGRELQILEGHSSVAYSPDGRRIAAGSWDKTVRIRDAETGREILTLKGHTEGVSSVAYSPDGRRIVSGSEDGTIKIWGALEAEISKQF
jgi:WD40 repeat protein